MEVEVDSDRDYMKTEFFVEAELNFVDMSKLQSKGLNDQIQEVNSLKPMKKVSQLDFKILNIMQGISEYMPVVFDLQYFC